MQLELLLPDAHLVAGLKAGGAQGGHDAHLVEAGLQVAERFLVGEVVPLEEHLDPAAGNAKGAVLLTLHPVAALTGRPIDAMLDLELPCRGRLRILSGGETSA